MLIFNIDHLHKDFIEASGRTSSMLLTGGSLFFEYLAALERGAVVEAAIAARKATIPLNLAAGGFSGMALQMADLPHLGGWTSEVSPERAAAEVYVPLDNPIVRELIEMILKRRLPEVFTRCAQETAEFSTRLEEFADRAEGGNLVLDDEYRKTHQLIRDWGTMMTQGQYVSSVCLIAATVDAGYR